jgi:uncharacterized DUF497 family protein
MKYFDWNDDKNKELIKTRNISFEDVLFYIERGEILDILEHINQVKYPNQKYFVINIDQYAYYVPFIEDEEKIFLKTIIPCRKLTKKYL